MPNVERPVKSLKIPEVDQDTNLWKNQPPPLPGVENQNDDFDEEPEDDTEEADDGRPVG